MKSSTPFLIALFFASAACQGDIGSLSVSDDGVVPIPDPRTPDICSGAECDQVEEAPVPVTRIPRLSHLQWEHTVQDLFGLEDTLGLSSDFDPDVNLGSRFSGSHERLVVGSGLWRDYQRAAESVAATVTEAPLFEQWRGDEESQAFVRSFASRVLRGPVEEAIFQSLHRLYEEGPVHYPALDPERAGARVLVEALLQTPTFLYRVELTPIEDEPAPLSDYELASRLSYLLWNSTPDDGLLEAASNGLTGEVLVAQAERLLDDPRALRVVDLFHAEHFSMNTWRGATRTPEVSPLWRPGLHDEMHESLVRFVQSIFRRDEGLHALLMSRRAFVGAEVAAIYGLDVSGNDLQEVELPAERAGLLTRAAFLTRYASTVTDPIHRGLFVHTRMLCQTLPPPPDNIEVPSSTESRTTRQSVEDVTHQPGCASCHQNLINPPGFALEGFGPIGETRSEDNGFAVNTTATYAMQEGVSLEFSDAVSLSSQLAEQPEAHACYTSHLLEFALGRRQTGEDAPLHYRMTQGSLQGELSLRELLLEIVKSRSFRYRTHVELEEASL